ncbi:MAG: ribonuclease R, partial [Pseudomonadota bacterium]
MGGLPSKDEILAWLRDNPRENGKRELARAFGVRGADRVELKRLLRELQDEGLVERRRKRIGPPGHLPPVAMLVAQAPDADGDIFALPQEWEGNGEPPRILVMAKKSDPALGAGDRFLARLKPV